MNILAVLLLFGSWFLLVEWTYSTRAKTFHETTPVKSHKFHDFSINVTKHSVLGGHTVYIPEKDPHRACYNAFFVDNKPPTGFRQAVNNIKFICQQEGTKTFYVTMYDEGYGLAIYSAYVVQRTQAKHHYAGSGYWKQNAGVFPGKIEEMYKHYNDHPRKDQQGDIEIQKGHLAPAAMFSFDKDRKTSTYHYTNAVPQYKKFNMGQWKILEERVRCFAMHCPGTLFVLTGTSEVQIQLGHSDTPEAILPQWYLNFPRSTYMGDHIRIPDSMWTAGCCVLDNYLVHGAFAVIGNNDPVNNEVYNVDVKKLQEFLDTGVGNKKPSIELFPGKYGCDEPGNQHKALYNLVTLHTGIQ